MSAGSQDQQSLPDMLHSFFVAVLFGGLIDMALRTPFIHPSVENDQMPGNMGGQGKAVLSGLPLKIVRWLANNPIGSPLTLLSSLAWDSQHPSIRCFSDTVVVR